MNFKKAPLVLILAGLVSCSSSDSLSLLNPSPARLNDPVSEQFYNIMVGELYSEAGDDKRALEHYLSVAMQNDDPAIAKRATQIASRSGQHNKAIIAAKRWLILEPKSLEARQYLALLLLRQQQYEESANLLHDIQNQLDKQGKNGIETVGVLLASEKNSEAAYQMYQHYQAFEPTASDVQLILSSLAFRAGHYEKALSAINPVITTFEGEAIERALLLKSKILYKLDRNDEAMQVLSPLMKSQTTTDVALLEYVRLLILDQRNADAATVLARLSEKHPNNFEITKALIALYLDLQEYSQAEQYIPSLIVSKKYQGVAHHFKAEISESRNELDSALNEYQRVKNGELYNSAQSRIPQLLMQQHGLKIAREWLHNKVSSSKIDTIKSKFLTIEATLLLEQHDYQEALELYNEADALTPNNIDIHYSRAIAEQGLHHIAKAEADFRFVLKQRKDDVNTLNALGYMLASDTDRLDEAQVLISKALSLRPDDVMIIDSLGWLYYRQENIEQAELYLRKAYAKNNDPEIASHLIEVLSKKGNREEALAIFKEMIKQYPDDDQLKRVKQKIIDYNRKS